MKLGRATTAVSAATFLSRIFGLVREQIFAALLGAGFYSDAFVIAFRIPNLLRDLFAEGALSSAFIPTFTEYDVKRSKEEAWALANRVVGLLLAVVGGLTLLGMIFAPQLVQLMAPGFSHTPGKMELTVFLTRIMFPFLPMVALAALFMGMLNVYGSFALPAFAPVLFNVVSILFGIVLWTLEVPLRTAVIGWSIGTLMGGMAQAGIQLPKLFRLGWKFRPKLVSWKNDPGLRQIVLLMFPAAVGLAATQINILVNSILASLLEQGAPSWLNYAFRFMQLPIGVFGVAIAAVTLPLVSRDAAQLDASAFRGNLTRSLNLVFLLTLPCAFGLWILGVPIVRLIYEHGHFSSLDTNATASALAFYALGLPFYAAVKVVAPALYAVKDARTPMNASITAVGVNIVFNLLIYRSMGFQGLALGTSLAATTNFLMLVYALQKKHSGLHLGEVVKKLILFLLASLVLALVAWQSYRFIHDRMDGFVGSLTETFVPIVLAGAIYFLLLYVFNVSEARLLLSRLLRRR